MTNFSLCHMDIHCRFLPTTFEPVAIIPGRPEISVIFKENDRSEDLVSDFKSTYWPHIYGVGFTSHTSPACSSTAETIVNRQGSNVS